MIFGSGMFTIASAVEFYRCDMVDVGLEDWADHPCLDESLAAIESGECTAGAACVDVGLVDCMLLCQLGLGDVFSTLVIASYMPLLGLMLMAFELQRNWQGGCMRDTLEKNFGFMFLYQKRTLFLLFSGLVSTPPWRVLWGWLVNLTASGIAAFARQ